MRHARQIVFQLAEMVVPSWKNAERFFRVIPGGLSIGRAAYSRMYRVRLRNMSPEEVFTAVYRRRAWGDGQSLSGAGSSLEETEVVRSTLPALFRELSISSILDIPCGDFNWMQQVSLEDVRYVGVDIIPELVEANRRHEKDNISFAHLDLISDPLPKVDLVFVRDCLVHLSNADILRSLRNIGRSGSTYLLTTTYTERNRNVDIATGEWRPLNLQLAPFGFPEPLRIINEKCPTPSHSDKSLGLWRIADVTSLTTLGRER